MYTSGLMKYALVIALVVVATTADTKKRSRKMAQLTEKQYRLIAGVCERRHWPDLWFAAFNDGENWRDVGRLFDSQARPGPRQKMRSIAPLMACKYGVQIYWFLSLAIAVIEECTGLSSAAHDDTSDCWARLTQCLEFGSCTMLEVIHALTYTHSTIGNDIGQDEFYLNLCMIRIFLLAVVLPEDNNNYTGHIGNLIDSMKAFLSSLCRPEFPRLNMAVLTNDRQRRFPSSVSVYDFYVYTMRGYMDDVSNHLLHLGFRYDANAGQTTFRYP